MQQEQHEWRFPVFILVEPDDVERDKNTGLLNLKVGFAVEVVESSGKTYACMFTSKSAIDEYVQFFRCPKKQIVEIENAHDFIGIVSQISRPGEVADAVVDFAGDENRFGIVPLEALLDLMRRMLGDQLQAHDPAKELPHGRSQKRR